MNLLRYWQARIRMNHHVLAWRQENRIEQVSLWYCLGYLTEAQPLMDRDWLSLPHHQRPICSGRTLTKGHN